MTVRRVLPAVALLLATLLPGLSACSGDEYVAPPPDRATEVVDAVTAASTLADLQPAVVDGDADAAAALGNDRSAADLLASIADNSRALGLTDVTFTYVTETGRTRAGAGWDALVAVTWRVRGFDDASARIELPVSFADGGRRIAAVGGSGARLPLWLAGPLTVRRTAEVVVLASGGDRDLGAYVRAGRRAVTQVEAALGGSRRLVLEVPADSDGLHRALDADSGTYSSIAAITAPVDGTQVAGSPVHVFLNPPVYDKLDPTASQVVMTHEAVHAVTGAALAQAAPLWLVEGFADHVALRRVSLPESRTAAQIIARVRKNGLPAALPTAADFSTGTTHLGAIYEAAWLVCRTLADRSGEDALIRLYDAVLAGEKTGPALRREFGWSEADLVAAWRHRLAGLAGIPG